MSARRGSFYRYRGKPKEGFLSHLLDPIDRLTETIYSILILLTFTLTFRIFTLEPGQVVSNEHANELLTAAVLATMAWGLIDGIVYVLTEVFGRGERHRILWSIQTADNQEEAIETIADELDFILEPITNSPQRQGFYRDIVEQLLGNEPQPVRLKREDLTGGLASVLIAFLAVLPSLVPFILLRHDYNLAIRVSNLVSFGMLFYAGYSWGKYTGTSPWRTGFLLLLVAVLMVAIAIPFGG